MNQKQLDYEEEQRIGNMIALVLIGVGIAVGAVIYLTWFK